MTYKEVNTMIASIGLPYAYNEFADGTGIAPPFICFLYGDNSDDLIADNFNYQAIRPLSIELYTDNKDFELEATVESALITNKLPFIRQETYLDSEHMFMVTYSTEVVIKEEPVTTVTEVNEGE